MSLIQATLEIPLLYFQCTVTLYTSDEFWGRDRGGPGTPLFLDHTEAQGAEKNFFETAHSLPPTYLRVWMTPPSTPSSEGLDLPLL